MKHVLTLLVILVFSSCSSNEKDQEKEKAEIYFNYGTSKLVQKEYTEALDNLLKAYKISPNESRILNNLGMAYFFKGKKGKATQFVKKAIELDPKNTDALVNLASLEYDAQKYRQAKQLYLRVLEDLTYKQQYRTYYNLALIAKIEKNREEAKRYFELSIQEEPNYCPSHYELGMLEQEQKNYAIALDKFRSSMLGQCYNNPAPHYQEAMSLIYLGKKTTAMLKLQDFIDRFPRSKLSRKAAYILSDLKTLTPGQNSDSVLNKKGESFNREKSSIR